MTSARSASEWNSLGVSRRAAGDSRGALSAFQRAAQVDPDLAEPIANAASVFVTIGDLERARASAHAALDRDEAHPVAWPVLHLAEALLRDEVPPRRALEELPASQLALALLASATRGHSHAARRIADAAVALRGDPALLFAAAILARTAGDPTAAATYAARFDEATQLTQSLADFISSDLPDRLEIDSAAEYFANGLAGIDEDHAFVRAYARHAVYQENRP